MQLADTIAIRVGSYSLNEVQLSVSHSLPSALQTFGLLLLVAPAPSFQETLAVSLQPVTDAVPAVFSNVQLHTLLLTSQTSF